MALRPDAAGHQQPRVNVELRDNLEDLLDLVHALAAALLIAGHDVRARVPRAHRGDQFDLHVLRHLHHVRDLLVGHAVEAGVAVVAE